MGLQIQKKARFYLILAAEAASLLFGGCSSSHKSIADSQEEASAIVDYTCISNLESEHQIYVILKNYHGNYWEKVIDGIAAASEEIDAAVYLGGIDNETDIAGQIALMEQAVAQGADGILLAPASSNSLIDNCQMVRKHEIPLVLIDSSINSNDYNSCYMTDNMDAGKMAAEQMLAMLYDAGNSPDNPLEIGIQLSSDTSQAMVNRVSGFLDYWANYAPEQWTIANDIPVNGGDVQKAAADTAALLKTHPQLKGLFGCNNTSTIGIASTILAQNRTDIVMAGFDLAEETRQLIENPDYRGVSLMQKQDQMGYLGMLSLDALIRGEAAGQKYFDTGVILIDSDYLMENNVS